MKTFRVFSALLLCVCFLSSSFLYAFASNGAVLTNVEYSEEVGLRYDDFGFGALKKLYLSPVISKYNSLCPSYRMLLSNEFEKACYDSLCSASLYDTELSVDFGRYLTEQEKNSVSIQHIADAFFLDHPETFWINTISLQTYEYRLSSSTYGYELKIKIIRKKDDPEHISEVYNCVTYAVGEMDLEADTRYGFLKKLHDGICEMTVYDWSVTHCDDPAGVFYSGLAVCEGYAEAFKMVCDLNRIPCILVIGKSYGELHMWNAVQMDDGKWYMVDATWDDQDEYGTFYDFFLCGLESRDVYFDEELFTESHTIATSHGGERNLTIVYPEFSLTAYSFTSQNQYTHFNLTSDYYADYSANILYALPDNDFEAVYYNGLWVPMSSHCTGSLFEAKTAGEHTAEEWTLAVYGDLDCDGDFDVDDYSFEVNAALGSKRLDRLINDLADLDGDGVIDVIDCSLFEKALNGDYTCINIKN